MDKNLFELSFRPHPRDKSNWEKLLKGTGIKILDSEINLDNQISEHGYVVAEGSTVIIQSILSSKIGIWINKNNELLEKYPNISLETEEEFIDKLKLFYHVANIGDSRRLAIHPAYTTHSQLSADDQVRAGVTPGYVRLSVGIEHIDDIIADLDQALA